MFSWYLEETQVGYSILDEIQLSDGDVIWICLIWRHIGEGNYHTKLHKGLIRKVIEMNIKESIGEDARTIEEFHDLISTNCKLDVELK